MPTDFDAYREVTCRACGETRRVPTGASLRAARTAAGVSQIEVEAALGLKQSCVSKVENERHAPSAELLAHYRAFLQAE